MQINRINPTFKANKVIPACELAKRMKQGMSYREIAQEFNVSMHAVRKSVKSFSAQTANKISDKKIIELYQKEYTAFEIKCLLGYPLKYIQAVINKMKPEPAPKLESEDLILSIMKKLNLDENVLKNLK